MVGLDTETHNGKAVLIATPRAFIEPWAWVGRDRFIGLVEWLRSQGGVFCCWNADYDIQAVLKWLPRHVCERLQRFSRARYKGLRLRFVAGKFFTVHQAKRRLVAVYDLMQFYACKLETAAAKVLGEHKTDPGVLWGQLLFYLRHKRSPERQRIIDYCKHDALLVERLYEKSKENMARIGVDFKKPVSCAAIAAQKFGKAFTHETPKVVQHAFEKTFRGGRMECLRIGYFPKAYLYDLHSAYPSIIAKLPEPPRQWQRIKDYVRDDAIFAAVKVRFRIPDHAETGPVPVKGDGQLMYPVGVWDQWLDLETYRVLESRGWIEGVFGGWQASYDTGRLPFAEIEQMYQERIQTPANAWALKIVMNAWYGKLAQRMDRWISTKVVAGPVEGWAGRFWRKKEQWTKKTCFVYAAAITAGIRRRLYEEVDSNKVIFYATDGIATTEPLPELKTGPGLGEWSEIETVTDLLVVGSGVYSYRDRDGKQRTKFRGFDVGLDLFRLLNTRRRIVEMNVTRNVTLSHALTQRRWNEFNELQEVPRFLDVNFDRKRRWSKRRTGRDLLEHQFESKPWRYYGEVEL